MKMIHRPQKLKMDMSHNNSQEELVENVFTKEKEIPRNLFLYNEKERNPTSHLQPVLKLFPLMVSWLEFSFSRLELASLVFFTSRS